MGILFIFPILFLYLISRSCDSIHVRVIIRKITFISPAGCVAGMGGMNIYKEIQMKIYGWAWNLTQDPLHQWSGALPLRFFPPY